MTYTEQDLRAVLGALESDAPDVAGTLAGVDRLRRRRTTRRRVVAVAAVTVTLAVGAISVPSLVRSNEQQSATSEAAEALRFWFAVDDIPLARVGFETVGPERQSAVVSLPSTAVNITVYGPGGYDSRQARTGEPADVNGRPGYYHAKVPCPCAVAGPGVIWEYAPDSWAVVHPNWQAPIDRAELLRVARAVRFDRTTPYRVPYKIGYLPTGLTPTGGTTKWSLEPSVTLGLSAADGTRLSIIASPKDGTPRGPTKPVPGYLEVDLGRFTVTLSSGPGHSRPHGVEVREPWVPDEELRKIAESITVAGEWDDPNTWLEAEKAFPTG